MIERNKKQFVAQLNVNVWKIRSNKFLISLILFSNHVLLIIKINIVRENFKVEKFIWMHANNNKEAQNLGLSMPLMWKHFYSQWCNFLKFLWTLVWNSCYWLCFFFSHVVSIWNYKGGTKKNQLEYFDLQKQHCHNKRLLEKAYI
jgi:hypothetical protein